MYFPLVYSKISYGMIKIIEWLGNIKYQELAAASEPWHNTHNFALLTINRNIISSSEIIFIWHSMSKCKLFRSYLTNIKQNSQIKSCTATQNFFVWMGYIQIWSYPRVNSRDLIVHNIYKWPPLRMNSLSEPIISADDTSVIISSKHFHNLCLV